MTWADFLLLPERPDDGQRYELQDGEVVVVRPGPPIKIKLQKRIERLLEKRGGELGVAILEFAYRPFPDPQYWVAEVAFVLQSDWDAMPPAEYAVYAPALIVEVLSS